MVMVITWSEGELAHIVPYSRQSGVHVPKAEIWFNLVATVNGHGMRRRRQRCSGHRVKAQLQHDGRM